ncbi:MAG TPA: hypothetical protein VNI61_10275, partial [Gemmatimonadales bacterium]|nr:hypothetical protein [Gemmatimonadales bacterium]
PATELHVVIPRPRVAAAAGAPVQIPVIAARGGLPQPGVALVLRGSGALEGPGARDQIVATDDSGLARFTVSAGRRVGSYRLEVAPAAGGALPGRPTVELAVRPGGPWSIVAEPRQIVFERGLDSVAPLTVTVQDSVGLPLAGEVVILQASAPEMEFAPDSAVTDSSGRVRFVVTRGGVRRGGVLEVRVRDLLRTGAVVALGAPIASTGTGFHPPAAARGVAGMLLAEPLVFEARTQLGTPAAGRLVAFRAMNASVSPDTALTDSAGRVRVEVTLGERAGTAAVIARVDSLEAPVTLQVQAGPPVDLVMERDGKRVDGGFVIVAMRDEFVLRVRLRDGYGNAAPAGPLAQMLRQNGAQISAKLRVVQLLEVVEEPAAVALKFRATQVGASDFKLSAGITSTVRLEVVPRR